MIIVFIFFLTQENMPKLVKLILMIVLIFFAVKNYNVYYSDVMTAARKEYLLEKFIEDNPPREATVWLWGRSEDFARLWSVNWTRGAIFRKELANAKPKLLELHPNLEDIWVDNRERKLFDYCWDQLYIQKSSLDAFRSKYTNRNLSYQKLDGTDDMYLVTSGHCIQDN